VNIKRITFITFLILLLFYIPTKLSHLSRPSPTETIPADFDAEKTYKGLEVNCARDDTYCWVNLMKKLTAKYGPANTLDLLALFENNNDVGPKVDIHYLGHMVGEATAITFGHTPDSFALCPMITFNGGCVHGFIEFVSSKFGSYSAAADQICGALEKDKPKRLFFSCYHGLGHGIMKTFNHDLHASLKICDELKGYGSVENCWSGVFMELEMFESLDKKREYFQPDKPFSICNSLEKKYMWFCYDALGATLLQLSDSIKDASSKCLRATDPHLCAVSIGKFTTHLPWLSKLKDVRSLRESALDSVFLCEDFPEQIRVDCLKGGLWNIINNETVDLNKRALSFCSHVKSWTKENCYREIGASLTQHVTDKMSLKKACDLVSGDMREQCYKGASLL
jgi:hypothetical protein